MAPPPAPTTVINVHPPAAPVAAAAVAAAPVAAAPVAAPAPAPVAAAPGVLGGRRGGASTEGCAEKAKAAAIICGRAASFFHLGGGLLTSLIILAIGIFLMVYKRTEPNGTKTTPFKKIGIVLVVIGSIILLGSVGWFIIVQKSDGAAMLACASEVRDLVGGRGGGGGGGGVGLDINIGDGGEE